MIIESSVSGVFKTVLMILGTFVLLRFVGQLLNAKRNIAEQNKTKEAETKFERDLLKTKSNFGKTSILNSKNDSRKSTSSNSTIEDVDYEEIT